MTQNTRARISPAGNDAIFIQLWRMSSADRQGGWLRAMRDNVHLLQVKPGFKSMVPHLSLDGQSVVVYAQWETPEALSNGVDDAAVKAARAELDRHGEPDGTVYQLTAISSAASTFREELDVAVRDQFVAIAFWNCESADQQLLLSSFKAETGELSANPAYGGLAQHASNDGTRVVFYSQWHDGPSAQAFAAQCLQHKSAAKITDRHAAVYLVEDIFLALAKG